MDKRIIIGIGAVAAAILVVAVAVMVMGGGNESNAAEVPRLDTFNDMTLELSTEGPVMVNDMSTVYFPIQGNGSDVMLIYSAKARVTWSDDEQPPAWRVTYSNEPDNFVVKIMMDDARGNGTFNTTADSSTGSLLVDLTPLGGVGIVKGTGSENMTQSLVGMADPGGNGTFHVAVSCVAGDIRGQGPHLLLYTDRGDEIDLTVTVRYKMVPYDIYEYWFLGEGSGT